MNRYEALKIAVEAHAGQKDKCGRDYILHPLAVAEALDGDSPWLTFGTGSVDREAAVAVALLHDVLEDTNYELPHEALIGFDWDALQRLSRVRGQSYHEYIERICCSPLACIVKLADLWHNLQPERQDCLPAPERKGLERRYLKARDRIWEAFGYEWWPQGEGKS